MDWCMCVCVCARARLRRCTCTTNIASAQHSSKLLYLHSLLQNPTVKYQIPEWCYRHVNYYLLPCHASSSLPHSLYQLSILISSRILELTRRIRWFIKSLDYTICRFSSQDANNVHLHTNVNCVNCNSFTNSRAQSTHTLTHSHTHTHIVHGI